MKTYAAVYLAATLLAVIVTPIVARLAKAANLVDTPGLRKVHNGAIPRIGGVAIFLAMLFPTAAVLMLNNVIGQALRQIYPQILALLAASAFIFLLGLIDDIKGLRARTKLLGQITAAVAVCAFGIRIDSVSVADWFTIDFGWWSWPITVFWIVGVTNAVNLIDGLDGLAAGIAAVTCAVVAVFALYTGQAVMAVLMLALLGSLSGFLVFNFNPARIFMGDCGSIFLGFILAAASVLCAVKSATIVGLAMPALALGVPIFDTLFSITRRVLERRSLFAPDRNHIHHRLLDMGFDQRKAVAVIYTVTLLAAGLGMFMMITRDQWTLVIFACAILLLLLVFRGVGAVRLIDSINTLKQNLRIACQARNEKQSFENAQLRMRQVRTFDSWWQAVCETAQNMDFAWISLMLTNRDGTVRTLVWRPAGREMGMHEIFSVTLPLRHRRAGAPLQLSVSLRVNGSLESAGRRAGLFGRLIDQHSLASLPCVPRNAQQARRGEIRDADAAMRVFSRLQFLRPHVNARVRIGFNKRNRKRLRPT